MKSRKLPGIDAAWAKNLLLTHLYDATGTETADLLVRGPIDSRDYSRIFHVESSSLPSQGALKLCLKPNRPDPDPQDARHQFEILEQVYRASSSLSLRLAPKPYLLMEQEAAILIEWIPGEGLSRRLFSWRRSANTTELIAKAAIWLRKFHDVHPLPDGTLDVDTKLSRLSRLENDAFQDNELFQRCHAMLSERADRAASPRLLRSWLHGDFKAENLLISNNEIMGIDIQARSSNVTVYDIAQFFNNIELTARQPFYWRLAAIKESLYTHFMAHYLGNKRVSLDLPLLWVRLYMLLSGWAGLRKGSDWSFRGHYLQSCYQSAARDLLKKLKSAI
jgi:hypothetical protein